MKIIELVLLSYFKPESYTVFINVKQFINMNKNVANWKKNDHKKNIIKLMTNLFTMLNSCFRSF